jgi:NADH dehydrogenase
VAALKNDATIGKTYDLCGPVAFTWNELYDKLGTLLELRRAKLHLPPGIAQMIAEVMELLLPRPPFNRDQLLMVQEDNVGDPGPARRDLFIELESFEEDTARYLAR